MASRKIHTRTRCERIEFSKEIHEITKSQVFADRVSAITWISLQSNTDIAEVKKQVKEQEEKFKQKIIKGFKLINFEYSCSPYICDYGEEDITILYPLSVEGVWEKPSCVKEQKKLATEQTAQEEKKELEKIDAAIARLEAKKDKIKKV